MKVSIPILTFHAVDDRPSIISFSPRLFQRGMARLHESDYRTIGLPELSDCLQRGALFPQRSFVITFDDGYQSVYEQAFPVLQRYGFSATVFLTVGKNGNTTDSQRRLPSLCERSMLNWHEIKEMHRCGITFGGHTLTHADLTRLPRQSLESEVVGGKAVIEDALGVQLTSFAYPFGRYDKRCREVVSHHFVCACSDRLGLVQARSDAYALERVDTYYLRTDGLFATMLTKFFPLYVRARAVPRRLRRAVQSYAARRTAD